MVRTILTFLGNGAVDDFERYQVLGGFYKWRVVGRVTLLPNVQISLPNPDPKQLDMLPSMTEGSLLVCIKTSKWGDDPGLCL